MQEFGEFTTKIQIIDKFTTKMKFIDKFTTKPASH